MLHTRTLADPDPELLELAVTLAGIEREARPWGPWLDELDASGVPLNAADDDDEGDEGDGKDDADGKGDEGDEGDEGDKDALAKARNAAAAANKELQRIKREQADADTKAKAEAGKWKDLYEETKAELEKVRADVETSAKRSLAEAALVKAKAKNPARAVRMLDLDDVEDEASAERAVKRLLKSDGYLFTEAPARQKRGAGGTRDEDDDDDQGAGNGKRPVNRLRRGLQAANTGG